MFRELVKRTWGDDIEDYDQLFTPKFPEKIRDHIRKGESVSFGLTHKGIRMMVTLEADPEKEMPSERQHARVHKVLFSERGVAIGLIIVNPNGKPGEFEIKDGFDDNSLKFMNDYPDTVVGRLFYHRGHMFAGWGEDMGARIKELYGE